MAAFNPPQPAVLPQPPIAQAAPAPAPFIVPPPAVVPAATGFALAPTLAPVGIPTATIQLPNVEMVFYCGELEKTTAGVADPDTNWILLFMRLTGGGSVPNGLERRGPGSGCRNYFLVGDAGIPQMGVYYVRRSHSGLTPITRFKIHDFPATPPGGQPPWTALSEVLEQHILPDATTRRLVGPLTTKRRNFVDWGPCQRFVI